MASSTRTWTWTALAASAAVLTLAIAHAQQPPPAQQPAPRGATSYMPVDIKEPFATTMAAHEGGAAGRPEAAGRPARPSATTWPTAPPRASTMSRGKPVQEGVRVKLPAGTTWDAAGRPCRPTRSASKDLFPRASCRCRIPTIPKAACSSRSSTSTRSRSRTARDLTRFDLDFDLPDHFLPEFPPPIFLTTRPDLGDVSQGQAGHDRQLLRAVQRHPEPEAARRPAPAGHAVPAAAVQPDRGPPLASGRAAA